MTPDPRAAGLPVDTYLAAIERETRRFRECLADADPGLRVPTCPDWTADDLLWHLGGEVQDFWAWVIAHRPEVPEAYEEPERPADRAGLLAHLDHAHEQLMLGLRNADPADAAWSWVGDPALHTVGFTVRRQAHEALIHRVDAELTVGEVTPLDPQLASDGVLECLEWMYGNLPGWAGWEHDGSRVLVHAADTGHRVLVGLGRVTGRNPRTGDEVDQTELQVLDRSVHGHAEADATITADAAALDLWLWHRGPAHPVEMEGDEALLDRLLGVLGQSID
ncbi:maleylpyruvate isomerase N-terminal domain-containing protein [Janibacter sp. G368]|uniref:maleylpyruvate isomerase N-terminal domain-containing protein n=1 Tax=Janibacter sp. G368 TaxID=3420441 RepID=UPI003D00F7F9